MDIVKKLRNILKAASLLAIVGVILTSGSVGQVEAIDQDLADKFHVTKRYTSFPVCTKSQVIVKDLYITGQGRQDGFVDACIYKTKKYDYAESSSLRLVRAIGQEKFYKIYESMSLVISGTNTEVATLRYNGSSEPSFSDSYVGITDSLSEAIEPVLYTGQNGQIEIQNYILNKNKFSWVTDSNEDRVQVEGVAISNNARFIAYVDRSYKLTLVDRETGSRKMVAENVRYWKGNYREPSFGAVSSNGRFVYLSGYERMYDTYDCRQDKTECEYVVNTQYTRTNLRSMRLYFDDIEEHLMLLNEEDNQLNRYDEIGLYGYLKLPNNHGIDYLALGDSYSSGEGDIDDAFGTPYLSGTERDGGCHLSYHSYPYLLRDYWGINSNLMKSVACSGAKVLPDYYGGGIYYGQNRQLLDISSEERIKEQGEALTEFKPGVVRQIDFVKAYKPNRITFTGGGNDVGFASIINYCASSYSMLGTIFFNETCAYVYDSQLKADLNRQIDDQYSYNKKFIENIKEVSPATEIYMIGYPQFVASGWSCKQRSGILDEAERQMIRQSVTRLNNTLKRVARDTNVYYVDIEDSLADGQICEGSDYMTGPLKVMAQTLKVEDSNMYHPNAKGHKKIAESIYNKISSGMDYNLLDIPLETNGRNIIRTAVLPNYAGIGSTHTVKMGPGIFGPDGQVTGDWFSQKLRIGSVHTESDGSLTMRVTIPKDIGIGSHLFNLSGVDGKGEPVVVQQFVNITSDIPGDADGDGIADEDDKCFALTEWYKDGENICSTSEKQAISTNFVSGASLTDSPASIMASTYSNQDDNPFAVTSSDQFIQRAAVNDKVASKDVLAQKYIGFTWWIISLVAIITVGALTIWYKKQNTQ